MTLEESKEVIPMMEAMITQIEEQQNIMAEMLQKIQEKDEKLMCFQKQFHLNPFRCLHWCKVEELFFLKNQ